MILVIKRHNLWHLWILEGPGRLHDILSTNYLYILDLSATWQCCCRSISLAKFVQTLPDNCLHRQHLHILEHGNPMLRLVASHLVLRLPNQLRTWLGSVAAGSQYCAFVTSSFGRFHQILLLFLLLLLLLLSIFISETTWLLIDSKIFSHLFIIVLLFDLLDGKKVSLLHQISNKLILL